MKLKDYNEKQRQFIDAKAEEVRGEVFDSYFLAAMPIVTRLYDDPAGVSFEDICEQAADLAHEMILQRVLELNRVYISDTLYENPNP